MLKKRKAQMIQSEIFVYILALVVFSLILLYGYNAIVKMRQQTNTVSLLQFKTDLTNTIEKLGYEYGTIEIKEFSMPSGFTEACFATLPGDPPDMAIYASGAFTGYQIINDSLQSGVKNNVFLVGTGKIEPFNVGAITVQENNFRCFNASSGKIKVKVEAKGSSVFVSGP